MTYSIVARDPETGHLGIAVASWYFLRFASPRDDREPFEPAAGRYWMPVDLYVGGAEHAVLHLLYARFWTQVMADAGLVPFREPFSKLLNQGQMLGPDGVRMSKSRGNVITPDSVVATFGADALRLYVMFIAPFDQDIAWNTEGISGTRRFLNRIWNLYADTFFDEQAEGSDPDLGRMLHKTIRHTGERIEAFRFNTMVSGLMEFVNALLERQHAATWHTLDFHQALETLLLLLAPAAPHIAEELWHLTGHTGSVQHQSWPAWDPELARDDVVQIAIQVNGKVRDVIEVSVEAEQAEVKKLALASPRVCQHLDGKSLKKVFYVPGRILNFVAADQESV